ncbi:globin domain-containing protein [Bradyrhizobium sp. USDA 10063]
MTPEQVDLIRISFDAMWPIRRDIADLCYSRFVELAPGARDLFAGDIERQRLKVLDMITVLVAALDKSPTFPLITLLGHSHARLGVQPSDYVAMGEALLWSLERKFGASFTPELRESWRTLYATAQTEMLLLAAKT